MKMGEDFLNYQAFVDTINKIACIISVKLNPDGTKGEPCIEAANDKYLESVNVDRKDFVAGRPYYEYIYKNITFEGLSYRSFLGNIVLHNYVYDENLNGWMDNYFTDTPKRAMTSFGKLFIVFSLFCLFVVVKC